MKTKRLLIVSAVMSLGFCVPVSAQEAGTQEITATAENDVRIPAGTLAQIEFDGRVNWRHQPRNSTLAGRLRLPLYSGERIAVRGGVRVKVNVESVCKVSDGAGKWRRFGRAVVRAFNPLEKSRISEYDVQLSAAWVESPRGELPISAKPLRAGRSVSVEQKRNRDTAFRNLAASAARGPAAKDVMLLALSEDMSWPVEPGDHGLRKPADTVGSTVHAYLLTPLAASRNRPSDTFRATTAEPVRLGDILFESGSLIEGYLSRVSPPKIFSRAGSMYLRIDRISSPQGTTLAIPGTLAEIEADSRLRPALDQEGILHGRKPGAMNAVADLGIAYAVGKVTDDLAETPIRAVGAAMSDAAVANAARYFGLGASVVLLVTRHGRDVFIPQYAELSISLGRLAQDPGHRHNSPGRQFSLDKRIKSEYIRYSVRRSFP